MIDASYDPSELPAGWMQEYDPQNEHPFWVSILIPSSYCISSPIASRGVKILLSGPSTPIDCCANTFYSVSFDVAIDR